MEPSNLLDKLTYLKSQYKKYKRKYRISKGGADLAVLEKYRRRYLKYRHAYNYFGATYGGKGHSPREVSGFSVDTDTGLEFSVEFADDSGDEKPYQFVHLTAMALKTEKKDGDDIYLSINNQPEEEKLTLTDDMIHILPLQKPIQLEKGVPVKITLRATSPIVFVDSSADPEEAFTGVTNSCLQVTEVTEASEASKASNSIKPADIVASLYYIPEYSASALMSKAKKSPDGMNSLKEDLTSILELNGVVRFKKDNSYSVPESRSGASPTKKTQPVKIKSTDTIVIPTEYIQYLIRTYSVGITIVAGIIHIDPGVLDNPHLGYFLGVAREDHLVPIIRTTHGLEFQKLPDRFEDWIVQLKDIIYTQIQHILIIQINTVNGEQYDYAIPSPVMPKYSELDLQKLLQFLGIRKIFEFIDPFNVLCAFNKVHCEVRGLTNNNTWFDFTDYLPCYAYKVPERENRCIKDQINKCKSTTHWKRGQSGTISLSRMSTTEQCSVAQGYTKNKLKKLVHSKDPYKAVFDQVVDHVMNDDDHPWMRAAFPTSSKDSDMPNDIADNLYQVIKEVSIPGHYRDALFKLVIDRFRNHDVLEKTWDEEKQSQFDNALYRKVEAAQPTGQSLDFQKWKDTLDEAVRKYPRIYPTATPSVLEELQANLD